ncbi:MAG TPA: sialidase family protein [Chryseolinea sp.]|nr:sialidase family protein [Chryseolinea sp.]
MKKRPSKRMLSGVSATLLMLLSVFAYSQQRIIVGENIRIRLTKDYNYSFENTVIADPSYPEHLVGCVLTMCPDTVKNCTNTLIESTDGGKTWSSENIPWGANPWCVTLPNADIAVSYIYGLNYMLGIKSASRSNSIKSRQWTSELLLGSGYDHNMLLLDESRGPFEGHIYLIATQSLRADDHDPFVLVARSLDGGKTFEQRTFYQPFKNVDINAKTPVILENGTLAIPILLRGQFVQGESKADPFEDASNWLITSNDGGQTFSAPKFISSKSGDGYHSLTLNRSPKWRGRLYYTFNGKKDKGIYITHSDDNGESWTKTLKIDNSVIKTQEDIAAAAAVHEKNGTIGVMYLSRVQSNDHECYSLFFTTSTDGGNTFIDPVRVNSEDSCPDKTKAWYINAWPQGGDYCSLIAKPDGSFLAIWSDARTGSFKLYQSTITIK